MEKLSKEYLVLFNGVTDAICVIESALSELKALQRKTEELCMEDDDDIKKEAC